MNDFHRHLEKEIPRLRRYASALTRNEIRADDLVQDTLTRAIEKEHLWEPGTDLRAWLFTIMHNQNVNLVRRAVREVTTLDFEARSQSLAATTDATASRQLWELERALGELPEDQRQVILLVGLEGMSYEKAAAIVNVPLGTIRSRLSRGRAALRVLMSIEERRPNRASEHYLKAPQDGCLAGTVNFSLVRPSSPGNCYSHVSGHRCSSCGNGITCASQISRLRAECLKLVSRFVRREQE
jgi:RNA polymerase sigma-70 factor (ECF subfamily)